MKKRKRKTTPRSIPQNHNLHVHQREIIKASTPRNITPGHTRNAYMQRKHRRTQPSQIHPRIHFQRRPPGQCILYT